MPIPPWAFARDFAAEMRLRRWATREPFPDWMRPLVKALPLTALNDGLRAVILDGKPLAALPLELGILAAWGIGSFLLALRVFRWT